MSSLVLPETATGKNMHPVETPSQDRRKGWKDMLKCTSTLLWGVQTEIIHGL